MAVSWSGCTPMSRCWPIGSAPGPTGRCSPTTRAATLERLATEREPLYAEVADVRLESDDRPDALVARLVDALAGDRQPS